jgi:hypothetical protein
MKKNIYSKNDRAERLLGKRPTGVQPFDQPCELSYHCPVYKYPQTYDDQIGCPYDERLEWSEYEGMIWCRVCNFDYPSPLCMPDAKKATEIFLDIIEDVKKKS